MSSTPLRVAVWSTGGVGSIAIPVIHRRPDLDLIGVWVYSKEKIGRDAGELANGIPIGLLATSDFDALVDLRPDCVVYAANGPEADKAAVRDCVRLLEAGINVVATSTPGATYPPAYRAAWREQLAAAAEKGQVSFYASGIEPGFAADHLPIMLTTQSSLVRSVHSYEIALYDDYPVASVMMDALGFGRPLDFEPLIALPGAIIGTWASAVRFVADALGVELSGMRETYDRVLTDRTLEVACGTIEAGTCGAIRLQAIGLVDGRDAIIVDHVTRMSRDVAPDWPLGEHDITYRIEIEGEPNITATMGFSVDDPARVGIDGMVAGAGAMMATSMRVVNAIPYIVDAVPGLTTSLDIPLTVPRHSFDTSK